MTSTPRLEPNYLVYLAPGADADEVDPDWVDVSDDLMSVQIDRGSPADLDQNNPGSATFILDNYAGTWDNENAASPYAGDLVPETQVFILAEFDGELYPRFRGTLDDIQLDYPDPGEATATFTATDGFKRLAQTELPTSVYVAEVLADSPVALWRLNEADGSPVAFDMIGGVDLTATGPIEFGDPSLIAREAGSAATLADGGANDISRFVSPAPLTGPPITVELVYRRTAAGSDGALAGQYSTDFLGGLYLSTTSTGIILLVAVNGSGATSLALSTGVDIDDMLTHHIVGQWQAGGALKIYVDGVDRTSGAPTLAAVAFTSTAALVFAAGTPPGNVETADGGTYQMAAFYNTALSLARIQAHADAVTTPWDGDSPGERAHRICDLIEWADELRDFDDGSSTLQSADLAMPALEHLQKVADSEFGALLIRLDGTLALRARTSLINRAPLAAFGDAAGEVGYRTITFDNSNTLIRNPVTVSRSEGVAQTVEDETNRRRFNPHQFTIDGLYHDSDDLSRSAAEFLVSEYKDPKRRITGLGFGPAQHDKISDWYPLILTAELGDAYEVTFRPPTVAAPFEQTVRLEGTSETWSPAAGHSVSWFLSPAFIGTAGGFWQLGVHGHSELGLTTRLYF